MTKKMFVPAVVIAALALVDIPPAALQESASGSGSGGKTVGSLASMHCR